jgi:hypothetical protein
MLCNVVLIKKTILLSDKTDNEVIFQDGIMSVKYYRPLTCDMLVLESGQSLTCASSSFCHSIGDGATFRACLRGFLIY